MDMEKVSREMIQFVPVAGGVVGYQCRRCGWATTVAINDTITRPEELFENHRCEDRERN